MGVKVNKYNVQAIRKELEDCIRHSRWKQFRSRYEPLSLELKRQVTDCSSSATSQHKKNTLQRKRNRALKSLLHVLCYSAKASPCFPVDILESMVQACPHLLHSSPSPLSILLDRQPSPAMIRCLVMRKESQTSLHSLNASGFTPLLQAVKHSTVGDEIVLILVEADLNRSSLLIPSSQRNRVPLYHVASQELLYVCPLSSNQEALSEELSYMLLQTSWAVEMERGMPFSTDRKDDRESWEETSTETKLLHLLHATVTCGHLLGDKHATKLLQLLLPKLNNTSCFSRAMDPTGNNLLHQLCYADHEFSEPLPSILTFGVGETSTLLEYVVKVAPHTLTEYNRNGQLPLHVALARGKPQTTIQWLANSSKKSTTLPSPQGQVALHLSILHYPRDSDVIQEMWRLYPEAANILDRKHQLYSFQLAAIPRKQDDFSTTSMSKIPSITTSPDTEDETRDLSCIFFLLRASPQVLGDFVHPG